MIVKKQTRPTGGFLTRRRVVLTTLVAGLLLIAASSCNRATDDHAGATAQKSPAQTNAAAGASQKAAPKDMSAAQKSLQVASTTPFAPGVLETQIQGVDGKAFQLADYKGKVVVLDLWATWCGPCRIEIPHLNSIKNQYGAKGVEVIGLTNEDPDTDSQKVRDFAREMKINYKLGWATPTLWVALGRAQSIPQTYVIGRDGRPVRFFAGFTPQSLPDGASDHIATPERVHKAIEQALGGAGVGD